MSRRFFKSSRPSPMATLSDARVAASVIPQRSSPTIALQNWWTQSDSEALIRSQNALLSAFVDHPFRDTSHAGLNSVCFEKDSSRGDAHIILAHGFGSGLGLFAPKVMNLLLADPAVKKVSLVDWMGMGDSERPKCRDRPIRRRWHRDTKTTSWSIGIRDAGMTPNQALDFFLDPFHEWVQKEQSADDDKTKTVLVGHSLGGYLSAQYILKFCTEPSSSVNIDEVVLASPVGFPSLPENALQGAQLPTPIRIVDALWSRNMTPQQVVRLMGANRGRRAVYSALARRIPHLFEGAHVDLLAEYLYQITVAPPSGEFAMNSLLSPAASPEVMGVFAREPLVSAMTSRKSQDLSVSRLLVLFGDRDWMRPNEPSARIAMDHLNDRHASSAFTVDILPNAGHHLYLDNSEAFVAKVLGH